jgi:hypothetical protein
MKVSLFSNKGRTGGVSTPLSELVAGLQHQLIQRGAAFASPAIAGAALSMESIDSTMAGEIESSIQDLNHALEGVFQSHANAFTTVDEKGVEKALHITQSQRAAGVAAAVMSGDIRAFLAAPTKHTVPATEGMSFLTPSGGDFLDARIQPALEAYDERENKNAIVYSVAYNMQSARQDDFGEAFFPTVVVTPDQVGFSLSIRLVEVMSDIRRQITGNADKFGRRNIVQAVIDPTILKNDQTKIVPVYRAEAAAHFVANSLVAPYNVKVDTETVSTAPLKIGAKFSLLAVSQTEALLETGLLDLTDAVDTAVNLSSVYMSVTDADDNPIEVFKFNTGRLPTANFTYAVQGNYRLMNLNFVSDSLKLGDAIPKMANGSNSTLLASLATYTVRLGVQMFGSVNLETSETRLQASGVEVVSITDAGGVQLDLASGTGQTLAALFAKAKIEGFDLEAQRTNSNRRQRGQLLTTNFYTQMYAVPLRSPITCARPMTAGDANDSSDLAALITATHVRTSNAAVDELLKTDAMLADYVSSADKLGATPEILGVSRFLIKPFYEKATLDVGASVDSLTSAQRAADIQATIVNKCRDLVYRMYTASGYKAAADALAGGQSQTPTIIIGTDPTIARYLMVEGDFRTLGPDFQVKVVSTLNQEMAGKIFMSFGDFTSGKDGVPNPMHFGNMAWKPELTLVLPIHRNGANSKELTVQPSFLHVTNLPILARIDVSGIEDVIAGKVTVDVSQ